MLQDMPLLKICPFKFILYFNFEYFDSENNNLCVCNWEYWYSDEIER